MDTKSNVNILVIEVHAMCILSTTRRNGNIEQINVESFRFYSTKATSILVCFYRVLVAQYMQHEQSFPLVPIIVYILLFIPMTNNGNIVTAN